MAPSEQNTGHGQQKAQGHLKPLKGQGQPPRPEMACLN